MSTLTKWNPIRDLFDLQRDMDSLFDRVWRNPLEVVMPSRLALDVHENDTAYTVTTALPGLKPEDIQIKVQQDVLTISGETEQETKDDKALLQERYYGRYERSIQLPHSVDAERVEAQFENGQLTITLPKLPTAQGRAIPIRATPPPITAGKKSEKA